MQQALIDKMGTGKGDVQVMIKKDEDNHVYVFTFATSSWHEIYEMVGRFYFSVGEDQIESYKVDETSNKRVKLLIIKVLTPWLTEEKIMDLIYEILNHWHQVEKWKVFKFYPVNLDLVLTAKEPRPRRLEIKAGEVAKYEDLSYRMY